MSNILAAIVFGLVLFVAGLGTGVHFAHQAARAEADEQLHEQIRLGTKASTELQAELRGAQDYARDLERRARHVPFVAAAAALPASAASAAVDRAPVHLTAGAVSVWNSALTGADVPANSCGPADPASRTCAAATDLTVDDAAENQRVNAELCRQDRIQLQRLINAAQGAN